MISEKYNIIVESSKLKVKFSSDGGFLSGIKVVTCCAGSVMAIALPPRSPVTTLLVILRYVLERPVASEGRRRN